MATYDAAVRKALPDQDDLQDRREHCSVDAARLATIGRAVGHQVRVRLSSDAFGLYTVSEVHPEDPDTIVRMGRRGRERLVTSDESDEFDGVVDSVGPHPNLTVDQARACGELVERLRDNGRQRELIVIAPHGGDIERRTDEQAEHVASRLAAKAVSSWRCKGWKGGGGAFVRWHVTSTDISAASFPRLDLVISRGFSRAVAFHGFEDPEVDTDVLIGGCAPDELKQEVAAEIDRATAGSGLRVRIAEPEDNFGGDDERNVVNRLTAEGGSGIQIEQSLDARSRRWEEIADAVAAVYDTKVPGPAPS
jgi:phage replication-related protein YjqB (UPF0714/DUF867 family)